ncbi:MAG: lysophospholipid acyltransferase family protein [Bdellovibrionales bacterium]|nr:lysophospholipid acyltransferase family protein [Ramlibacter sp.]
MQHLFRLSARLPLSLLHALGALLGWVVYLASGTYRQRFRDNTALAGITHAAARGAIAATGRLVTEMPWVWLRPQSVKQPLISWKGGELIEAALSRGKGVILMTPHLGSFEAAAQGVAGHFAPRYGAMTTLYKPSRFAWFDAILREVRSAPGLEPAPTTTAGVRLLLRALKAGRPIGLLPDQVPGEGLGVWAPFFGRPAYTMTLAFRLARQTGAPMLLAWSDRLPGGQGYVINMELFELPADASNEAAAAALNAQMEQMILKRPDLYLWGYARYKQPRQEG